jgi:hypothetical protein
MRSLRRRRRRACQCACVLVVASSSPLPPLRLTALSANASALRNFQGVVVSSLGLEIGRAAAAQQMKREICSRSRLAGWLPAGLARRPMCVCARAARRPTVRDGGRHCSVSAAAHNNLLSLASRQRQRPTTTETTTATRAACRPAGVTAGCPCRRGMRQGGRLSLSPVATSACRRRAGMRTSAGLFSVS